MIIGIEGNLGNGKTATMARMALHYSSMCSKCNGIINHKYVIDILFEEGWGPHDCICESPSPYKIHANFWINEISGLHYITTIEDIDKIYEGFAFLDEFWSWIDSRVSGYSDINLAVTGILLNSRKRGYNVIYESKLVHMVDRRIRELTDYVLRPNKYVDINGELIKIEQNLLYPINIEPYLDDSWICVDELYGGALDCVNENLFQFKITDVSELYNTKEEIKGLGESEHRPGLEKGMKMETVLSEVIKKISPKYEIVRGGWSRGWDLKITDGNKKLAFDSVSVRKPRKGSINPTIDVRGKKIDSLMKSADKSSLEPYFAYVWNGKWFVLPMLESYAVRTEISCRDAIELEKVLL